MDIKDILSGSSVKQIAKAVGIDEKSAEAVLKKAVPALLENMSGNSKKSSGAQALQKALLAHADDDDDVNQIDRKDGAKIISHILGDNAADVKKSLSKAGGLDSSKVDDLLSIAGPMVMKSVGQKTKSKSKSGDLDLEDLLKDVMKDGLDLGDLKKIASKIDADDVKDAAEAVSKLFGNFKK